MSAESGKDVPRERHGVIFAIVGKDKRIELEERDKTTRFPGYIFIPGGGVEPGETLTVALFREVFEEYGVVIGLVKKLGIIPSVDDDGVRRSGNVFLVKKYGGKLSNPEGRGRHLRATIQEARELCTHPLSHKILDLVEADLSQNS